jgi:hypothetical protein
MESPALTLQKLVPKDRFCMFGDQLTILCRLEGVRSANRTPDFFRSECVHVGASPQCESIQEHLV